MLFSFNSLLEKEVPYVVMQHIDPEKNMFRIYLILLREEQGSWTADLCRGRISHTHHRKQKKFDEKSQFFSFLKSNIATRKRHGYSLVDMSLDFPLFKSLGEMVEQF